MPGRWHDNSVSFGDSATEQTSRRSLRPSAQRGGRRVTRGKCRNNGVSGLTAPGVSGAERSLDDGDCRGCDAIAEC